MLLERDADPALLYDDLRQSFCGLVAHLSGDQLATNVPATPLWNVADVLAHVVGITSDLNHSRFGADMDPDVWTASQVEVRRCRSVSELAAEWDAEASRFVGGLRLFGYSFAAHYLADLLQHVADVRQSVGMPPPPDGLTLAVATDFYVETLDHALRALATGSLRIQIGDETIATGDGAPVVELAASRYEVFRALGGRRSESQLRALEWRGELDAVLAVLSPYPLPAHDIVETVPP